MKGILDALVLLCGLDYVGPHEGECIAKTKVCYEREMQATLGEQNPKKRKSEAFFKCYHEGVVNQESGK